MGFFNHTCSNCGHKVSPEAKFCSACRAPQANANVSCESCGASVPAKLDYCWKCSANLKTQAERRIYDDRWMAAPNEFAIRMVLRTSEGLIHNGVEVGPGTLGLLFQAGHFLRELPPGYYSHDAIWHHDTKPGSDGHVEVVLVNMRPTEIGLFISGLRDAKGIQAETDLRLEVEIANVATFVETIVRQLPTLDAHDLSSVFQVDVEESLRSKITGCSLLEIAANGQTRDLIAGPMKDELQPLFKSRGLRLNKVRIVRFGGEDLDQLLQMDGELSKAILLAENEEAQKGLARKIELNQFRSSLELEEAKQKSKLDKLEFDHQISSLKKQADHQIDSSDRQHQRSEQVLDAEHRASVADIQHQQKQKKLSDAINTWKQVEELKHKRNAERVKLELEEAEQRLRMDRENKIQLATTFQGIDTQAALVASGASSEQLIELARIRNAARTPDIPKESAAS